MNELFDAGSLRLSCDPLCRLNVDGLERLPPMLDVKAYCIHCAVSIGKRRSNGLLIMNVGLDRLKLRIIRRE